MIEIEELRKICQTPESALHDMWFGRVFCRKYSIYFTRRFIINGVKPNEITVLWALLDVLGAVAFIFNHNLSGFVLLFLGYFFDSCDGEVARYTKTESKLGLYLDRLMHSLTYPIMFLSITLGSYFKTGQTFLLLFGLSFAFFNVLTNAIGNLVREMIGEPVVNDSNIEQAKRSITSNRLKKIVKINPASYEPILFLILVGAIFDAMFIVVVFEGLMMPLKFFVHVFVDLKYFSSVSFSKSEVEKILMMYVVGQSVFALKEEK